MNLATAKADIVAAIVAAGIPELPDGHVLDHEPQSVPGPFAFTLSLVGGAVSEDVYTLQGRLYAQVGTDVGTAEADLADLIEQVDAVFPVFTPRGQWTIRRALEVPNNPPLLATVAIQVGREDF